jgi:nitrite reductase/ring-hydroxylating ferredoxin subunit
MMTRLCPSAAVPEGEYRVLDFPAWSLVVARVKGALYAVENVCGHQSLRLDGGEMKTGPGGEPCLQCPHHAMCFSLVDGRIVEDAGHLNMAPLTAFPATDRDGNIWVDLPSRGGAK